MKSLSNFSLNIVKSENAMTSRLSNNVSGKLAQEIKVGYKIRTMVGIALERHVGRALQAGINHSSELGSPLWLNATVPMGDSISPPSPIRVFGRNVINAGSRDEPEDDASESTPLNELLRRQQRQGQVSRKNLDEASYKVASILLQESIFGPARPKTTKAKPAVPKVPLPEEVRKSPKVVSLLTPDGNAVSRAAPAPDGDAASTPFPAVRSVPMKQRIIPAKKPATKEPAATPKRNTRAKKSTPKTPKAPKKLKGRPKGKAKAEEPLDPEIVVQKRAAELIVGKEIQGAEEAMDLDLFGEVVSMTDEEKDKKGGEMHAEAQRKLVAKATEQQAKEEAEEVAEMERMRVKAEKEERRG